MRKRWLAEGEPWASLLAERLTFWQVDICEAKGDNWRSQLYNRFRPSSLLSIFCIYSVICNSALGFVFTSFEWITLFLLDFTLILGCLVLFSELTKSLQLIPYPLLFDISILYSVFKVHSTSGLMYSRKFIFNCLRQWNLLHVSLSHVSISKWLKLTLGSDWLFYQSLKINYNWSLITGKTSIYISYLQLSSQIYFLYHPAATCFPTPSPT